MKTTTLKKLLSGFSAIALVCLALSSASHAVPINYMDLDDIAGGGTVTYVSVEEASVTDPTPLYGAPSISLNTLSFTPPGFGAFASGGGIDITDGILSFDLEAESGTAIDSFSLSEFGAYTVIGSGTAATEAIASSIGFLTITEVDGISLGSNAFTINDSFVQSFNLMADGPAVAAPWSGSLGFSNLGAELASRGISAILGVTKAEYVMNNQMIAISEPGTVAFIDKKDLDITIGTIVPEPTSAALALLACCGLGLGSRRNRR